MNQNIFNRILAVASLAMLAAARIVDVDEDMLRDMSDNDEKFVMSMDETLTLLMDEEAFWRLSAPMDAPYSVFEKKHYIDRTMPRSDIKIAWEISYSGLYSHPGVNTVLNFLGLAKYRKVVPIGLRID